VVCPKGTQLGFTEIGLIWVGQGIVESQSALVIEPTESVAKKVVRQKFRPMLLTTTIIRDVFRGRSADSTLHFSSATVDIMFAGSNSPANFASVTVPRFFGDEIDRWSDELKEEGDPLDLAANRIADYGFQGKMFLPCSPTVEGASLVWKAWLESDQRIFETPCPCCGHLQQWLWENMRCEVEGDARTVKLYCVEPSCQKGSTEAQWKGRWGEGRWRATNPKPIRRDTVGFHLSTLYGRLGGRTWASIMQQYIAVVASGQSSRMQVFWNTILGLPWKLSEDTPQADELRQRLDGDMAKGVIPHGGLMLTAGIDYQKNRLEAFVWAFGPRWESWLVDKVEVERLDKSGAARPSKDIAEDLKRLVLERPWPHADGGQFFVEMAVHDASDRPADVFDVLDHLSSSRNVGLKGDEGWGQAQRFLQPKIVDIRRDGKIVKSGRKLARTHTAEAKRDWYEDLRRPLDAEGGISERYVHLPKWVDEEEGLLDQFVAEELRKSTRGKLKWEKVHTRNEALDCAILARWGAWNRKVNSLKPHQWAQRQELAATPVGAHPTTQPKQTDEPPPESSGGGDAGWIGAPKKWL
jgi:phage terminase large subunit GpA-like protein